MTSKMLHNTCSAETYKGWLHACAWVGSGARVVAHQSLPMAPPAAGPERGAVCRLPGTMLHACMEPAWSSLISFHRSLASHALCMYAVSQLREQGNLRAHRAKIAAWQWDEAPVCCMRLWRWAISRLASPPVQRRRHHASQACSRSRCPWEWRWYALQAVAAAPAAPAQHPYAL